MTIITINDLKNIYKKQVPKMFSDFVEGGSWTETTLESNRNDFQKIKLLPRIGTDISHRSTSTEILGRKIRIPAILAPIGMLGMQHADGEILAAKAATEFGVPFCLSTMSICSIEAVAKQVKKPFWFQLYPVTDEKFTDNLINRASHAGCDTLILTMDCKVSGQRNRDVINGLTIPYKPSLTNILDVCSKPKWIYNMLKSQNHSFGNLVDYAPGMSDLNNIANWTNNQFDKKFTWDDVDKLRNKWHGKLVIKGIMTAPDAVIASEKIGVDAIVVSNHGGRQLDGCPSTISVLANIKSHLKTSDTQIFLDSRIMSGQDIFKSLALGADAVLIGRSYVYGLGALGKAGVLKSLLILEKELDLTMALCGINYIENINRDFIHESM